MEISEINAISDIAMRYENLRMQVASTNIAFANQVASSPAETFKTLQVKMQGFDQLNSSSIADIESFIQQLQQRLQVSIEQNAAVKPVHSPEDPMADAAGFVYKPDVNMVNEMLTLTTATRAYEANIRAFNTGKDMSRKALEIGK